MTSSNKKEMKRDQLIIRNEYPQIPSKVEYRITTKSYNHWNRKLSSVSVA